MIVKAIRLKNNESTRSVCKNNEAVSSFAKIMCGLKATCENETIKVSGNSHSWRIQENNGSVKVATFNSDTEKFYGTIEDALIGCMRVEHPLPITCRLFRKEVGYYD